MESISFEFLSNSKSMSTEFKLILCASGIKLDVCLAAFIPASLAVFNTSPFLLFNSTIDDIASSLRVIVPEALATLVVISLSLTSII